MPNEIERKFRVSSDWKTCDANEIIETQQIAQAYLNRDKQRTVRVRITDQSAWLTIKGPTVGFTRAEFEYAIPINDAKAMLELCDGFPIKKSRYHVRFETHVWHIDEFQHENEGLVIAEIELESESEPFATPPWLAAEVSEDARYFNSRLAEHPFTQWPEKVEGR